MERRGWAGRFPAKFGTGFARRGEGGFNAAGHGKGRSPAREIAEGDWGTAGGREWSKVQGLRPPACRLRLGTRYFRPWTAFDAAKRRGDGLAKAIVEGSRRENGSPAELPEVQQVAVACDETVGLSGQRGAEDGQVRAVAAGVGRESGRDNDRCVLAKERDDGLGLRPGDFEFSAQVAAQFLQDGLREDDVVARKADLQDGVAQAARGEGSHQDVGVEDDFHERASKTSSSVRNPWASAKGAVFRRRARNFSAAR